MTITKFSLPSIRQRLTLPEELAGIIMRQIEAGDFKPGDVLPSELSLAETFNVSRTVVREALARLKFEGVIESKRGSGAVVCDLLYRKTFSFPSGVGSPQERADIIEFRLIMEGECAALAAARRTEEQLRMLKNYLDSMREAIDGRQSGLVPDYRFHCLIAEAAQNLYIKSFIRFLSAKLLGGVQEARALSNQDITRARVVHEEHCDIYEGIRRQSPEEARAAVHQHLTNSALRQGITLSGPLWSRES